MRLNFILLLLVGLILASCSSAPSQAKPQSQVKTDISPVVEQVPQAFQEAPLKMEAPKISKKMTYYKAKRLCKDSIKRTSETRKTCIKRMMNKVSPLSE